MFLYKRTTARGSDIVEDAKRVPLVEQTDPLDAASDDCCMPHFADHPIIEVKWENYPEVKMEDADENRVVYEDFSAKVRVYACHIFMFSMHAV